MTGKRVGRGFMFIAAVLLCVGAGVGVGRLSVWNQVVKGAPAAQFIHTGQKATAQGIKIHGWWTIKVFEGGRLVREHQFENALTTGFSDRGDAALVNLLTRTSSMGPWRITANTAGGAALLFQLTGPSLTVNNSTPGHVILSGNYTPTANIAIAQVWTFFAECPDTIAPASCDDYFSNTLGVSRFNFTSANLASPVAVVQGQQVQLTVDISFS